MEAKKNKLGKESEEGIQEAGRKTCPSKKKKKMSKNRDLQQQNTNQKSL